MAKKKPKIRTELSAIIAEKLSLTEFFHKTCVLKDLNDFEIRAIQNTSLCRGWKFKRIRNSLTEARLDIALDPVSGQGWQALSPEDIEYLQKRQHLINKYKVDAVELMAFLSKRKEEQDRIKQEERERERLRQIERDKEKAKRAHQSALNKFKDEISGLTPTKRLDALLKDRGFWVKYPDILQENGISFEDLEKRAAVLEDRKKASQERAALKKMAEQETVRAALEQDQPLLELGIEARWLEGSDRPVALNIAYPMPEGLDHYRSQMNVRYATGRLFPGFHSPYGEAESGAKSLFSDKTSSSQGPSFILTGSHTSWHKLVDGKDSLKRELSQIKALNPRKVDPLNTPDAAELSGLTRAAFDDAVAKKRIPIFDTEPFQKWGKTLYAKRFSIRDILEFREQEADRFIAARENRIALRRKLAAKKAKETRNYRKSLLAEVSATDRQAVAQLSKKTGDLTHGLHLQLFLWAQRASRMAKTSPSKSQEAYELKDDALSCLFQQDALDLSFVPAPKVVIIKKCFAHNDFWYDPEDLFVCPHCKTKISHKFSLYACSLKSAPEAGTLHMPLSLGQASGFPGMSKIPKADHDRAVCYGRSLDADEVGIFPLKRIKAEIERLVSVFEEREEQVCA